MEFIRFWMVQKAVNTCLWVWILSLRMEWRSEVEITPLFMAGNSLRQTHWIACMRSSTFTIRKDIMDIPFLSAM